MTINGTAFTTATSVTFNGTPASYTINTATRITATVPADATTGPIQVETLFGSATSASPFTVAPRITGFAPASGAVGASVVITGATSVTFNGTPATAFMVDTPTRIRATVPAGATPGRIVVNTSAGTGTSGGTFVVKP